MLKKRLKLPKGGNERPWIEWGQTIQWPQVEKDKKPTIVYKTMHRKLKIAQYESHLKQGVISCAPETVSGLTRGLPIEVSRRL